MQYAAHGSAAATFEEDHLACLALALTPGLGLRRIYEVLRKIGAASRVFAMPLTELESLRLPAPAAQCIFEGKARQLAEDE